MYNHKKGDMHNATDVWAHRCMSCTQFIGDVGREYKALVAQGVPGYEAARSLGLYKVCCLIELNAPTNYSTNKPFHTGAISDSVLHPKLPVQVYSLRKGPEDQINVNLYKEPTPLKTNAYDREPALRGIVPPSVDANHDIRLMKSGEVAITGFQLDKNGEPVLIDVGMGYKIPRLTYLYKL